MLEEYLERIIPADDYQSYELGYGLEMYSDQLPSLTNKTVALLGIEPKDQNRNTSGKIRKQLYKLTSIPQLSVGLVDLGNIKEGATPADTHLAIKEVSEALLKKGIVTVLLGSHLDQGEALYEALEVDHSNIEISLVSSHIPVMEFQLLNRICSKESNNLLNINAIGFQSHFIAPKALDIFENLNFGYLRLGRLKASLEDSELYLRNSALTLFDIGAIKYSDAPGNKRASPCGLEGEEACQIARYAGLSDDLKSFGLFGYDQEHDHRGMTSQLCAQIIWYFLDGFVNRINDKPSSHDEFVKYRCDITENQPPIIFLKSKKTSRWWMQIAKVKNSDEAITVPCSYSDYQQAVDQEIPDRYLRAIKQLV